MAFGPRDVVLCAGALMGLAIACSDSGDRRDPGMPAPTPSPGASEAPTAAPSPSAPVPDIELREGQAVRFEVAPLTEAGDWVCAGFADLAADGRLALVAAGGRSLRFFRFGHPADDPVWPREQHIAPPEGPGNHFDSCGSGDVDGDGLPDFVLVTGLRPYLLRNLDGLRFEWTALPELPTDESPAVTTAVALLDMDGDGDLDLYLARSRVGGAAAFVADGCTTSADGDTLCGLADRRYTGATNLSYRNDGAQGWTHITSGAEDRRISLAAMVADLDGDAVLDLLSVNDGGLNGVFLSVGAGRFEERGEQLGLQHRNHGMGSDLGDLNGDGHPDLVIADIGRPTIFLGGEDGFALMGAEAGFGPTAQYAWGTELEDFDNDGDLDLLFENELLDTASWARECPNCGLDGRPTAELLLYRSELTERGRPIFAAESVGDFDSGGMPELASDEGGKSMAAGDADGDGVLDIALVRHASGSTQDGGPAFAVWSGRAVVDAPGGAVVVDAPLGTLARLCAEPTRCWQRQVLGTHSYRTVHPARAHFGVGDATALTLTLEGPRASGTPMSVQPGDRVVVPPARPFCRADTIVTPPQQAQLCRDGSCTPAATLRDCRAEGLGCRGGECVPACVVDGCLDPPPARCEGDVSVSYPRGGQCSDGVCDYEALREELDCASNASECAEGACVPLQIREGDIVVNEFLFDMDNDRSRRGFLELRNTTRRELDVDALELQDRRRARIRVSPQRRIPAGGILTVHFLGAGEDPSPWAEEAAHVGIPVGDFALDGDGGSLGVFYRGLRIHRLAYATTPFDACEARYPASPNTAAQRDVEYAGDARAEAVNTEWCAATQDITGDDPRLARYAGRRGTPGMANSPCAERYDPCGAAMR